MRKRADLITALSASGGIVSFIEIELVQWDKHQPRKDIKHPTWFAVNNRIMEDPKLFGLTDAEWKALFYIFAQASQQNSAKVKIYTAHAAGVCQVLAETIRTAVEKLADVGVVVTSVPRTRAGGSKRSRVRERTDHVRECTDRVHDTTLQDTTLHNKQDRTVQDIAAAPAGGAHEFIAAYCERFKERWGVNPPIQGKDAGILKQLAKGMSLDRFKDLLDAFFQMPDAWIVKGKHTVAMFHMKLNEIVVYADAGKFTTSREAQQADNTATNAMLLAKVQRGEI